METKHYSLSEAEDYTGKSRSSLRRFVESITKPDEHPDRQYILPTVDEVAELHANSHPFSWKISETLLDREFRKEGNGALNSNSENSQSTATELLNEALKMLKTELDEKNKQIAQFQQSQRETNILLQQTTEKLALLTEGKRSQSSSEAVTVYTSGPEEGESSNADSSSNTHRETIWEKLSKSRSLFRR